MGLDSAKSGDFMHDSSDFIVNGRQSLPGGLFFCPTARFSYGVRPDFAETGDLGCDFRFFLPKNRRQAVFFQKDMDYPLAFFDRRDYNLLL